METRTRLPERGFYYHYKHDPNGPVNNYAYEVIGVGRHTENNCAREDRLMVIYRPLYEEATVFREGKLFDLRPLDMFMEDVEKDGRKIPRFRKVTHDETIAHLGATMVKMYHDRVLIIA